METKNEDCILPSSGYRLSVDPPFFTIEAPSKWRRLLSRCRSAFARLQSDHSVRVFDGLRCFARRHMPAAVSAFHAYALAVSEKSRTFYSDARRDAWEFGVNKDTIVKWTHELEEAGWFRRIDRGLRLKRNPLTGSYESIRYEVLDHDAWAKTHRGKCRFPPTDAESLVPKVGTEALSEKNGQAPQTPVRENLLACPTKLVHLSEITGSPVRVFRTK